jgi:ATP-dependent RNA helicase DDX19/DBP5
LISGHRDFQALKEIAEYFRIILQRLDSSDWDGIETNIQKVLKSSRAGANFQQEM